MRFITIFKLCGLIAVLLSACGNAKVKVQVNGIDVQESEWKETTQEIGGRLRFEFDCDGPYEFVLIKKVYRYPSEVGVVACDKKWLFTRKTDGVKKGHWLGREMPYAVAPQRRTSEMDSASPYDSDGAAAKTPPTPVDATVPVEEEMSDPTALPDAGGTTATDTAGASVSSDL